jgi:hypothetical protein
MALPVSSPSQPADADDLVPAVYHELRRLTAWWRTHQLAVMALYLVACGLTWQVKE